MYISEDVYLELLSKKGGALLAVAIQPAVRTRLVFRLNWPPTPILQPIGQARATRLLHSLMASLDPLTTSTYDVRRSFPRLVVSPCRRVLLNGPFVEQAPTICAQGGLRKTNAPGPL